MEIKTLATEPLIEEIVAQFGMERGLTEEGDSMIALYVKLKEMENEAEILKSLEQMKIWNWTFDTEQGSRYFMRPNGLALRWKEKEKWRKLQPPVWYVGFITSSAENDWMESMHEGHTFGFKGGEFGTMSLYPKGEQQMELAMRSAKTEPSIGLTPIGFLFYPGMMVERKVEDGVIDVKFSTKGKMMFLPPTHIGHNILKVDL